MRFLANARAMIIFGVLCMVMSISTSAETIQIRFPDFDSSVIETSHGVRFDSELFGYINIAGAPRLPSRIFAVALPPNAKFTNLEITNADFERYPEKIELPSVLPPRVIGQEKPEIRKEMMAVYHQNRDAIYSKDEFYPEQIVSYKGKAASRHLNLAEFILNPIQWNPISKEIMIWTNISIEIEYVVEKSGQHDKPAINKNSSAFNYMRSFVVNYDEAQNWYSSIDTSRELHDFVIITQESLVSSISSLVDWETQKGRSVQVVTVEWIGTNYSGNDLAQKMRNFLREKYPDSQWGIKDVLLIGGYSEVPMRLVNQDPGYGKPKTDFYYAELSAADNESWDSNNNGLYWDDNDDPDFYNEINVGRIPWSDSATVQHICEKSVLFETNNDNSYKKNILLLGAYFWDDTDNAELMEAKVNQTWMQEWTKTRLYEQNSDYYSSFPCDLPLTRTNTVTTWSQGRFSFVNWAGHGSPTSAHILGSGSAAFIASSDCNQLNDEYPSIVFADACSNSDTDETNIGMSMLKKGAVGFVGATKVAYGSGGWSSPADGSSQSMDYYFTTAVTSGEHSQGAAHQIALISVYQVGGWYYPEYEIGEWNIWGNPDLGYGNQKAGSVVFDKSFYNCQSTVSITVRDSDLNTSSATQESVVISVVSASGDSESVTLNESGLDSPIFTGSLTIVCGTPIHQNNQLEVAQSDTLTAIYIDHDDGYGGVDVEKSDIATIDSLAPVISNISVSRITHDSFTVTWTTDEPANASVYYGTDLPADEVHSPDLKTSQSVTVTDLNSCSNYIFYIMSEDEAGNSVQNDNNGSYYVVTTYEIAHLMNEMMDTDPQWTLTGSWAWGQPHGTGGSHGGPDPTSGYSGNNVYGYNLNGDYTNSMQEETLTTPPLDCTNGSNTMLSFYRWLGVETSEYDHAMVKISTNGTSWTTIWENPEAETSDTQWVYQEFDISQYADGRSTVYIRWTMGPTDSGWTYCGWNIDDVMISGTKECENPPATPTPRPTVTPTPDPYEATPTSTPLPKPGMELILDDTDLGAGDEFNLHFYLRNPTSHNYMTDLYLILNAYGSYFFWPSWRNLDTGIDYLPRLIVPPSAEVHHTVLTFIWPSDVGSGSDLVFYGASFDSTTYDVIGDIQFINWKYHP